MDYWLELLDRYGLATTVLLLLLFWLRGLAKRLVDRHIQFVDSTDRVMHTQTQILSAHSGQLDRIEKHVAKIPCAAQPNPSENGTACRLPTAPADCSQEGRG